MLNAVPCSETVPIDLREGKRGVILSGKKGRRKREVLASVARAQSPFIEIKCV